MGRQAGNETENLAQEYPDTSGHQSHIELRQVDLKQGLFVVVSIRCSMSVLDHIDDCSIRKISRHTHDFWSYVPATKRYMHISLSLLLDSNEILSTLPIS